MDKFIKKIWAKIVQIQNRRSFRKAQRHLLACADNLAITRGIGWISSVRSGNEEVAVSVGQANGLVWGITEDLAVEVDLGRDIFERKVLASARHAS